MNYKNHSLTDLLLQGIILEKTDITDSKKTGPCIHWSNIRFPPIAGFQILNGFPEEVTRAFKITPGSKAVRTPLNNLTPSPTARTGFD